MPAPRSLADDLRSRDDDALVALLASRPDLASPVPGDTSSLAARASTRVSTQRAVDRLATPELEVLEALVALAGTSGTTSAAALVRACSAPRARVLPHLRRLLELALAWGPDSALQPTRAVVDVLGPHPAGLGPSLAEALGTRSPARTADLAEDLGLPPAGDPVTALAGVAQHLGDPDRLAALLDGAPAAARDLLDRLVWGPPTGAVAGADRAVRVEQAASPLDWLLARGLLAPAGPGHVVLPREVALALRGGRVLSELSDAPPPLADPAPASAAARRPGAVDGVAAGQAAEAVRLVEELLTAWGSAPPAVLRAGGLGVRELKRLADRLEVDTDEAASWAELARAAGLVADDGEADAAWAPTPAADAWLEAATPQRWAVLALAWLRTSRVPGLVGEKDARGTARTALSDDLDRTAAAPVRRGVLDALAELEPGQRTAPGLVEARVRWRAPRRAGALTGRLVAWALQDAARLGVTGLGELSGPGRALLAVAPGEPDPPPALAAALAEHLPPPVEQVLLQADLTAVAPGPLVRPVAVELALLADVDSRGGATVYRFTPTSVRRAMDAGRSADDALAFLRGASATPVPQALEVLVRDVARRYGRLRIGVASSYLRSDDEAALAEVMVAKAAAPLRLRRLAPTVAAAQADATTVLSVLRGMGLAPAVEGDDDVVVGLPTARRTPARTAPRPVTGEPPTVPAAALTSVVAGLRTGDADAVRRTEQATAGEGPPPLTATDPALALAALRDAAAAGRAVWLGLADAAGRTQVRQYSPVHVTGGLVTALDAESGQVRTFSVHRISGVAAV